MKKASSAGQVSKSPGRRGTALTIGLNEPDRKYYGGKYTALKGAEKDARAMAGLARKQGFKCTSLIGRQATWKRVTSGIAKAAACLENGDIFLLTFSGHGSAISPSWIENLDRWPRSVDPDEWVQTCVLFDKELLDKELRTIWTTFKRGVRVLVVLDSCYSFSAVDINRGRTRLYSAEFQRRVLEEDGDYYASKLEEALPRAQAVKSTRALILSLAACQDDQQADDGDRFGLFTEMLLSAWSSRAWPDYVSLLAEVKRLVSQRNQFQEPGLRPYPGRSSFAAQPPFEI